MWDQKRELITGEEAVNETTDAGSEEKKFPPKGGFNFEDPRLGHVTGNEEPLKHLKIFPQTESHVNVSFRLHYNEWINGNKSQSLMILSTNDTSMQQLPVRNGKPLCQKLVGVIHGFTSDIMVDRFVDLRNALLNYQEPGSVKRNRICVLAINWKKGAKLELSDLLTNAYAQPAANTITVGRLTGLLLFLLRSTDQIREEQIHLIGHSLGSQVAHFASEWFRALMQGVRADATKFRRITGLDPAARHFRGYAGAHIQASDASFVDIIHTSAVHRFEFNHHMNKALPTPIEALLDTLPYDIAQASFGDPDSLGHVDFYPNSGIAPQPGCLLTLSFTTCSHSSSIDYFIDSLNSSIPLLTRRAIPCQKPPILPTISHCLPPPLQMIIASDSQDFNFMGYDSEQFAGRGSLFLIYRSPRLV